MKKMFFAVPMIILLLFFIKFNDIYITKVTGDFENIVGNIETNIDMNDFVLAKENIRQLEKLWHKKTTYIQSVSLHSDWEKIYETIERISAFINKNEKAHAAAEINLLSAHLTHIREQEKFSLSNIL